MNLPRLRPSTLAVYLGTWLTLLSAPAGAADPAAAGYSRFVGRVVQADGKTPVVGATIVLRELSSQAVLRSTPTTSRGTFELRDVPLGYYDLAVETPEGLFVGNAVVDIAPSSKEVVNLTLAPGAQVAQPPDPATSTAGMVQVREKVRGRDFWRSPKGVAILAGGGAVVLLALASSTDEEPVASQFTVAP